MSNSDWKLVRKEQHPAIPDMAFALEINSLTLEFRIEVNGQTFTGRDGTNVVSRAVDYLRNLEVQGNWQLMIELARYSTEMVASRWYIRVEDDGSIVRHPWIESPAGISLLAIERLRHHWAVDQKQRGVPPCEHHEGLSSYYHFPYTPEVWERVQEVARTFNGFFDRLTAFLKTVSKASPDWPAHFLQQWEHLSFFEADTNVPENG